jgi:ribonuclease HI
VKYYAVKRGRNPGIYSSWTECREQTAGYSGAVFKSFEALNDAQEYLNAAPTDQPIKEGLPLAYIDGSYSKKRDLYSYGGFIFTGREYRIIQGTGGNPKYIKERNIAGEVIGALQVMFEAQRLQIAEINLFYDCNAIEQWAVGNWKAVTPLAQYYQQTADLMQSFVTVHFHHVKGHAGIEGNEIADYLAKEAAGVQLRKKDIAALAAFRERVAQENLQAQEK